MVRLAVVAVVALALSGCAMGPAQFERTSADVAGKGVADWNTPAAPVHRSGLGMTEAPAIATPTAVIAADGSAKAPKGALADRDYSQTKLDAEHALAIINSYRTSKGLAALKLDPRLTIAAKMLSRDLARTDRISHYGSDGSSPWDRVKRSGYDAKLAAENVGTGQASVDEVFKGWTENPGHNRNLLLPAARDMGIALVTDTKTEFKTFWTLVVASSR